MDYKLINKALNEIFNGYKENLKFSTFMKRKKEMLSMLMMDMVNKRTITNITGF